MSLNIECGFLRAECLNHVNDVYIYFDGGFIVWNCNSEPFGVWFNGDMFMLAKWKFTDGKQAAVALNEWVAHMLAV